MAHEFIAKKGFISQGNAQISGSLTVIEGISSSNYVYTNQLTSSGILNSGNLYVQGNISASNITASLFGTASFTPTSSLSLNNYALYHTRGPALQLTNSRAWYRVARCTNAGGRGSAYINYISTGGTSTPNQIYFYVSQDWQKTGSISLIHSTGKNSGISTGIAEAIRLVNATGSNYTAVDLYIHGTNVSGSDLGVVVWEDPAIVASRSGLGYNSYSPIKFSTADTLINDEIVIAFLDLSNATIANWSATNVGNNVLQINKNGTFIQTGSLGIGVSTTTNKLHVQGNISASSITASLLGTASYSIIALSASYSPGSPSISASYSDTSSYSIVSLSASYAPGSPSLYSVSSSFASSSLTASYLTSSYIKTNYIELETNLGETIGLKVYSTGSILEPGTPLEFSIAPYGLLFNRNNSFLFGNSTNTTLNTHTTLTEFVTANHSILKYTDDTPASISLDISKSGVIGIGLENTNPDFYLNINGDVLINGEISASTITASNALSISPTAPSNPITGKLWYDTSDNSQATPSSSYAITSSYLNNNQGFATNTMAIAYAIALG